VQAIHRHHHRVLRFYVVVLYILRFSINTVVSVLGIATRGQYYWILDIGCLVWYRSNPTLDQELIPHRDSSCSSSCRCWGNALQKKPKASFFSSNLAGYTSIDGVIIV